MNITFQNERLQKNSNFYTTHFNLKQTAKSTSHSPTKHKFVPQLHKSHQMLLLLKVLQQKSVPPVAVPMPISQNRNNIQLIRQAEQRSKIKRLERFKKADNKDPKKLE